MQSPSIQDFSLNSKRRNELQNQHNAQLQLQQLQQLQQQQQQQQQQDYDDMIVEGPPFKKQRPGVTANFLYKVAELAAYTTAFASDAFSTITGGHSTRYTYDYDDEVLQINDEDEENDLYDHKFDKKDESAWEENAGNVEEEEPPPPYESSWYMPSQSTTPPHDKIPETRTLTTPALSSSPSSLSLSTSQEEYFASQQPLTSQNIVTRSSTNTTPRRRQFRVRRGRRLIRRKSSSVDMNNNVNASRSTSTQPENDDDDIFLKFNCKLSDMIAEAKAALNSKVDVTDVEMMIAEEKEKDERIKKEFGIQTSVNRRARRHTGSSTSSDFDYFNSILGSGGHSHHSSISSCDNGFSGGLSCYTSSPTGYSADSGFSPNRSKSYTSSPTSYSVDNGFSTNRTNGYTSPTGYSVDNGFSVNRSVIGRSSPTQYGPPGGYNPNGHVYHQHFGGSSGGYSSNGHLYPYTYFAGSPGYGSNGHV